MRRGGYRSATGPVAARLIDSVRKHPLDQVEKVNDRVRPALIGEIAQTEITKSRAVWLNARSPPWRFTALNASMTKRSSSREKRAARTSGGIFRIPPMMESQAQPRGAGLTAVWQYRGPSKSRLCCQQVFFPLPTGALLPLQHSEGKVACVLCGPL